MMRTNNAAGLYRQSLNHSTRAVLRFSLGLCICIPALASAAPACNEGIDNAILPAVTLRVDNDMFGASGQDQGYSNGLQITLTTPNLANFKDDPCLPGIAKALNHYLDWLQPEGFEQRNMVFSISQSLFTPTDRYTRDLIVDDRPYAASLLASIGFNARTGNHLQSSHLRFGVVGPAAMGFQVQNAWHKLMGLDRFMGWDNQLHNEPVFQLIHERMYRADLEHDWKQRNWGQDMILHWGGAVGNLGSHLNAGAEWRFGWRLPDDFGSTPLRPAGENTAPPKSARAQHEWRPHLFVTFDARWVANNITLDGNTFKDSHSVKRRPFVADIGYGLVVSKGLWKVAFARYHRTREFDTQKDLPVFGSVTVSKQF
jgi:lipid A 3-O-deacylase